MKHTDSLDALQSEIERKREQAARLEQERIDLELEIAAFEAEYNTEIKPLQDQLDQAQRHIDEYTLRNELLRLRGSRLSPMQLEAEVEQQLRERDLHAQRGTDPPPPRTRPEWAGAPGPAGRGELAAELKSLYRELAKRFHPDLATGDAEREARGARMAEINVAYAQGDLGALRRAGSSLSAPRDSQAPTLAELRAERDRLDAFVLRLKRDIAELNRDPLLLLKLDAALARHRGRDLLAEMATELHVQLVERQGTLDRLIGEFRVLVQEVGLA